MSERLPFGQMADQAFNIINDARKRGRLIVPLLGSGISIEAGIPTSRLLVDYIVTVCAIAELSGWQDTREYLRVNGWPHRHSTWAEWLAKHPGNDYDNLNRKFNDLRTEHYRRSVREEMRRSAPLYARFAKDLLPEMSADGASFVDYRSLLSTVTQDDTPLIDAFFDHFIRGRRPATTHQFIAFVTQLLNTRLLLTTNFDPLIEMALRDEGLNPTVYEVTRDGSVPSALLVGAQPLSIVKLHGGTHSLRTGYDLDERLPIATLDEFRAYLKGSGDRLPLLVVVGYSGSDRRVMDLVADHMTRPSPGRYTDYPRVLWVSREGEAPILLKNAITSVIAQQMIGYSPATKRTGISCKICAYRSARMFFQEMYQVLESQHAVTRSSYRAIASVPRDPRIVSAGELDTISQKNRPNQFKVFWSSGQGNGTSTALIKNAYELGRTHEIIWIDANDFTSRASIVAEIQDEFSRLDREHTPITRPVMMQDVDFLSRRLTFDTVDNPAFQAIQKSRQWECEVAVRWITQAMRRSNYILAIDSLGEFAQQHPSVNTLPYNERYDEERAKLLDFLQLLCSRSSQFGRSVVMVALTPMRSQLEKKNTHVEDQLLVLSQLNQITSQHAKDFDSRVDPHTELMSMQSPAVPRDDAGRPEMAVKLVCSMLGNVESEELQEGKDSVLDVPKSLRERAAALLVIIASIFRRPRSRSALLATTARYVGHQCERIDQSSLRDFCFELRKAWHRTGRLDTSDLELARVALQEAESKSFGPDYAWRLISRLEGGFIGCIWIPVAVCMRQHVKKKNLPRREKRSSFSMQSLIYNCSMM